MKLLIAKVPGVELIIKFLLVVALFLGTFLVYKMLQKPVIYNATLKNISHTYNRDVIHKSVVWKVDEPYYYMDEKNTRHWDGASYASIKDNYYNGDDRSYGFFPLFPFIWEMFEIDIVYIGLFNYLLFGISVILLSIVFLKNPATSLIEQFCVLTVSLILPPIVVFYMPYAEAVFIFTFTLAVYGLIKNKYGLFFISMVLFAMTRPIFVVVGLSFIIMDILYFIKHKNLKHFLKELFLKLSPLLLGTFIVFFMFYLNSGSFMKYFESLNKYWNAHFSIPDSITDWSIEGFGMNVFAIFFIIFPSAILFIKYFWNEMRSDKRIELPSVFSGNSDFIKTYFFNNSVMYFGGIFCSWLFYQAGELNGINRYTIASPFFFIFLFYFYSDLKEIKLKKILILFIPLTIASLIVLTSQHELEPPINFNDSGYITLLFSLIYLISLKYMNNTLKVVFLFVLIIYNIVWITYLYNIFLCDGWIFT
jgi:hypothetical protein